MLYFRASREVDMANVAERISLKTVGANGQISFGKKYAGRHMIVEEQAEGVWLVRTARVIPDSEAWAHEPKAARDLDAAMAHAVKTKATAKGADDVLNRAANGE
jgi:hypothetical protein